MAEKVVKDEISLKKTILSIRNFFLFLKQKWKTIVLSGVIGVLLGIIWYSISPAIYTATTSFIIENRNKTSSLSSTAAKLGLGLGNDAADIFRKDDNMITFLKSRTVIANTLYSEAEYNGEHTLLARYYYDIMGYPTRWEKHPSLASLEFHTDEAQRTVLEDSVVTFFYLDLIKDNLQVLKPDKEQDVIVIAMSSTNELFAKQFAEKLMENVTDLYINTQTRKATEDVAVLQRQVDSVRTLLDNALSGAAESIDATPNLNPAYQRIRVSSQKKLVEAELNKAILVELVKNLEMARITLLKETPLVQIIDPPILPLQKKEAGLLKTIFIMGFLGTGLGTAYVWLRYYLAKLLATE